MISKALSAISNDLNQFLKNRFNLIENPVNMASLTGLDGSIPVDCENKIILSVVNIEEETSLQKATNTTPIDHMCSFQSAPAVYINLYILVSAFFQNSNYNESLKILSSAISFFQQKPVFTPQNTPCMADFADKFQIQIYNTNMNELNYFWGQLGGKYIPSVLYKLRMLTFNGDYPIDYIDTVTNNQIETGKK